MRVLHVTDEDLPGRHFSGYDLLDDLAPRGIDGTQAVLRKHSTDPRVVALWQGRGDEELQFRLKAVERRNSINDLLPPWGRLLAQTPQFREADVVHYHLIHNQVISLYDVGWLFEMKPSVWTFHDPWPLTGHCVHPMGCEGWLGGCTPCPYLDRLFALREDRAGELWRLKRRLFASLDLDVVVASDWMRDMVRRSPITSHLERVHLIPFGVDPRGFLPDDQRGGSRRRLGVPDSDFVVLVRASNWEVKGLRHVIAALETGPPVRPTTLITVDKKGLLKELRHDYRLIELGWVADVERLARAYSASDVMLMPSVAESFGLMAVEAMAAGRPVISFEGTAVARVTAAPACGISVPMGDSAGLRRALDALAADPAEARRRGRLAREIATREFRHETYLDRITKLYRAVAERRLRATDG